MNARIATIAVLATALACAERETPQPSPPASPVQAETQASGARMAPITVRVDGPPAIAVGESTLSVTLTRAVASTDPVELGIVLPAGVTVIEGDPNERVVEAGPVILRKFRLRVVRIPEQDVLITASVRGEHYGARATSAYRFGRAEPKLPQPPLPAVGLTGGPARKQE